MFKKFTFFILFLCFAICSFANTAKVIFEGREKGKITFQEKGGKTFVEAESLAKYLRFHTNWFWSSGQLNIRNANGYFATLREGQNFATVKGKKQNLTGESYISNKKLFVSVDFFTKNSLFNSGEYQTVFQDGNFIIEKHGALKQAIENETQEDTEEIEEKQEENNTINSSEEEVLDNSFFAETAPTKPEPKITTLRLPKEETTKPKGTVINKLTTTRDLENQAKLAKAQETKKKEGTLRIFIDPGHGDKDPGAVYSGSAKEKQINLEVAKEVVRLLQKERKVEVKISRNDDTFIPLGTRAKMANDFKADIFVSIHANAAPNRKAEGFEIYFRSDRPSDKEAEQTAALENEALNYEIDGKGKITYADLLLNSLATNENINESSKLSAQIRNLMYKKSSSLGIKVNMNNSLKQANFYVLQGVKAPSVLVEMGYLSNRNDKKRLNNKKVRLEIAETLKDGILAYAKTEGWKL